MIKKTVCNISLVLACCFCIFFSACTDNKSDDNSSAPKTEAQSGSDQSAGSQSLPPQTPPREQHTPPPGDAGKCDALLTAKCTECHNTNRICEKLGKKSKARWQRTIDRMTERGAKLTPEETAMMLICLDGGIRDLQSSCR